MFIVWNIGSDGKIKNLMRWAFKIRTFNGLNENSPSLAINTLWHLETRHYYLNSLSQSTLKKKMKNQQENNIILTEKTWWIYALHYSYVLEVPSGCLWGNIDVPQKPQMLHYKKCIIFLKNRSQTIEWDTTQSKRAAKNVHHS